MILALALALFVTTSGALATYIYDEGASLAARLCTGACIGLASFGLIGFVLSSLLGLTPFFNCAGDSGNRCAIRFLVGSGLSRASASRCDSGITQNTPGCLHPGAANIGYFVYYAVAAILFWLIFDRAMM